MTVIWSIPMPLLFGSNLDNLRCSCLISGYFNIVILSFDHIILFTFELFDVRFCVHHYQSGTWNNWIIPSTSFTFFLPSISLYNGRKQATNTYAELCFYSMLMFVQVDTSETWEFAFFLKKKRKKKLRSWVGHVSSSSTTCMHGPSPTSLHKY